MFINIKYTHKLKYPATRINVLQQQHTSNSYRFNVE